MTVEITVALLNSARRNIGTKAVGMTGECWRTKEITEVEKERDEARMKEGIYSVNFREG